MTSTSTTSMSTGCPVLQNIFASRHRSGMSLRGNWERRWRHQGWVEISWRVWRQQSGSTNLRMRLLYGREGEVIVQVEILVVDDIVDHLILKSPRPCPTPMYRRNFVWKLHQNRYHNLTTHLYCTRRTIEMPTMRWEFIYNEYFQWSIFSLRKRTEGRVSMMWSSTTRQAWWPRRR